MSQKNAVYTAGIALAVIIAFNRFGKGVSMRHGS